MQVMWKEDKPNVIIIISNNGLINYTLAIHRLLITYKILHNGCRCYLLLKLKSC